MVGEAERRRLVFGSGAVWVSRRGVRLRRAGSGTRPVLYAGGAGRAHLGGGPWVVCRVLRQKGLLDVCDWEGKGCTGSGTGRKCKQSCHQVCDITAEVVWTPRDFVGRVMPKVEACGFTAVDSLKSGVDVGKRVANSGLENEALGADFGQRAECDEGDGDGIGR